ncbi:hypothetical protein [Bradyrhizobium guangdongense]|uniref:hypothetical protein n=1 Tax=Bradyrhizobium guangdongense TaxID=1325090 RepID=UPI0010098B43|nr:hypothetical protein [Bradyrhizobium guangdongense]
MSVRRTNVAPAGDEKSAWRFRKFSRTVSDNANCVKLETKSRENYVLEINGITRCTIARLRPVDVTTALVLQQKHSVEVRWINPKENSQCQTAFVGAASKIRKKRHERRVAALFKSEHSCA